MTDADRLALHEQIVTLEERLTSPLMLLSFSPLVALEDFRVKPLTLPYPCLNLQLK